MNDVFLVIRLWRSRLQLEHQVRRHAGPCGARRACCSAGVISGRSEVFRVVDKVFEFGLRVSSVFCDEFLVALLLVLGQALGLLLCVRAERRMDRRGHGRD